MINAVWGYLRPADYIFMAIAVIDLVILLKLLKLPKKK